MKQDQNQKRRKRMAAAIAILLTLALVFSALAPLLYAVQAEAAVMPQVTAVQEINERIDGVLGEPLAKEIGLDRFSMNLSIGFDGEYMVGKTAAISGVIDNLGEDFEGELQIRVGDYEGSEEGRSTSHSIYYIPLTLPKGGVKQVDMAVTMGVVRNSFQVSLVDKAGNVVYLKNEAVKPIDPATQIVGVLTEHPEALSYLSALNMAGQEDYTGKLSKTVYFSQATFPSQAAVLKSMKAIIIDDFDTRTLTPNQLGALKDFTAQGGMLILGTGPNAPKVLGGLSDFADFQMGQSQSISAFPVISDILQINAAQYGPMVISPISAQGLHDIFMEDGKPITSAMEYGQGTILVHNFALSLKPAAAIPNLTVLLRTLYENEDPTLFLVEERMDSYGYQLFWMADNFPFLQEKSLNRVLLCVVGYLIMVGPVLYILLKKKNQREKGWIYIPALSILFTAAIILIGRASLYQNNLLRSISVTDLPKVGTSSNTDIAVAVKTADSGSVKLHMDGLLQNVNFNEGYSYYGRNNQNQSELKRKILAADNTEVTYYNLSRWQTSSLTASLSQEVGGNFESTLHLSDDGKLVGRLENNTSLDFQDVIVAVGEEYIPLQPMEAGEGIDVEENMPDVDGTAYSAAYYDRAYQAVGLSDENGRKDVRQMIRQGEMSRQEAFDAMQKARMLEQVYNPNEVSEDLNSQGIAMTIYAFSNAPVLPGEISVNDKKAISTHLGLYRSVFIQRWADMGSFEIPYGMIKPQVDETRYNYDKYDGRVYTEEAEMMECQFPIPQDIAVSGFTISQNADPANLTSEPVIFNYETQEYEALYLGEYENPSKYIGEEGIVKMALPVQQNTEIIMPQISIKGVGLHAAN